MSSAIRGSKVCAAMIRPGDHTTHALPSLGAVLNRDQRDHRQVEDLTRLKLSQRSEARLKEHVATIPDVHHLDAHGQRHRKTFCVSVPGLGTSP